jgi:hypothetical protein
MMKRVAAAACALLGAAAPAQAADGDTWPVAGRQGVLRYVIVPAQSARDPAAYAQQIERLCGPAPTCFLNFYTNSTGAPLAVPLPDAIAHEATAVLRRSAKRGMEGFRFACRLQTGDETCF